MSTPLDPPLLLREARRRAGLSQRALAVRAKTAQSVVARIESGQTDPSSGTLTRLLRAAGAEARCRIEALPVPNSHMLADMDRILSLSPEDRLLEVANVERFLARVRRV